MKTADACPVCFRDARGGIYPAEKVVESHHYYGPAGEQVVGGYTLYFCGDQQISVLDGGDRFFIHGGRGRPLELWLVQGDGVTRASWPKAPW